MNPFQPASFAVHQAIPGLLLMNLHYDWPTDWPRVLLQKRRIPMIFRRSHPFVLIFLLFDPWPRYY